ncbi:MAG: TIGR02757 family protein, partial [Ginsengibacter sp.]
IFAWGIRKTIINKSLTLMQLMDNAPHDFCVNHEEQDLKKLLGFCHRTFNDTDLLYFISFFKFHYTNHSSLETAFFNDKTISSANPADQNIESALNCFYDYFFSLEDVPNRTLKHIAAPKKNSACKRLNMYLRWMVRDDHNGVDFGIWKTVSPSNLICPIDVHVARVARKFGLLTRNQVDLLAAEELTNTLRKFDKNDPAKYDFALFSLGVLERF